QNNNDDGDDDDDDDDKDAVVVAPDSDGDPAIADIGPAAAAIRSIQLDAGQRAAPAKLRADSGAQVQSARRRLETRAHRLPDTLRNASASEDDIARQIESISAVEATIRKARILSWVRARSLLHKDQRRLVEEAVKRGH